MPIRHKLVIPAAGAGALLALAFTFASVEMEPSLDPGGGGRADALTDDLGSSPAPDPSASIRDEERASTAVSRRMAVAVMSHAGEDALTARWAELSPEERVRELRVQYRDAIAAMRRGSEFESNRARAEAAVSALRAELYGAPAGREEHELLEDRLQALVERERDRSELGRGGAP